jgi:hypothetical protein
MKNLQLKVQVLNVWREDTPLKDYVQMLAADDPQFFRWLFGVAFENDFDLSLTDKQREKYNNWLNTL